MALNSIDIDVYRQVWMDDLREVVGWFGWNIAIGAERARKRKAEAARAASPR